MQPPGRLEMVMMQYDLPQLHSSALDHLSRRLSKITELNKNKTRIAGEIGISLAVLEPPHTHAP